MSRFGGNATIVPASDYVSIRKVDLLDLERFSEILEYRGADPHESILSALHRGGASGVRVGDATGSGVSRCAEGLRTLRDCYRRQ